MDRGKRLKNFSVALGSVAMAEWDESAHPRDEKGRFGGGGGVDLGHGPVVAPGMHKMTSQAVKSMVEQGRFSTMSAANPGKPLSDAENQQRMQMLAHDLTEKGAIFTPAIGRYTFADTGKTVDEPSFIVHHTQDVGRQVVEQLAQKYGQEAVVHSENGNHFLHFISGDRMGQEDELKGHSFEPSQDKPHTIVPEAGKFGLGAKGGKVSKFSLTVDTEEGPVTVHLGGK